ncbi:vesicular inhibitory amino acid transporter-like [Cololabis saira]|uniref:vesicular inhibitory amino acid transporter-like n=1 Tax=Cololabis saira TaxID=129043 RepID=UPI002AD537E5|nr:vesicular inhibitory amino acid transporter-like [Cololabis saira]
MGSLRWFGSPQQPGSAAGCLWDWAASKLHLEWTTRFFQEDEEMLILTHKDELNQTYSEDERFPVHSITRKNEPSSSRENSLVLQHEEDPAMGVKPAPNLRGSTCTVGQDDPDFKEARTVAISTGTKTITTTSDGSTSDSLWSKSARKHNKQTPSMELHTDRNEEKLSFKQNQECKRESCRGTTENVVKWGLSEDEEGEKEEDSVGGTFNLLTSFQNDQVSTSFADSVQTHSTSGTTLNSSPTITAWEAGWNVTNAIQGIFVLALPFALVHSGYMGLVLLVLSAWICNHTGSTLVACLYEVDQSGGPGLGSRVRVRHSYQDVMEACCKGLWPNWSGVGGCVVNVAQVIELLMTCTLYLLVSTSLLSESLSGAALPRSACSLVALMFLLPCLLLSDLRPVSTLSLLCSLAHILISLLVTLYCLSCARTWSWSSLSLSVDPEDFFVSVGVIIFSYTSQIFLPPLEGSMEDRGQFNAMLKWTHAAACVMKTLFSLVAVLTWGIETREVVTDNLPSNLRPVVNLCLLAKALLSYPLPFYAAAEILQTYLPRDASTSSRSQHRGRGVSRPALMARGALLLTSYLLALLVPRFSLLMGLTGSVTGAALTLILPCLFHLKLQWRQLSVRGRLVDVGILSLGIICSILGVICSVKRLMEGPQER